MRKSVSVGIARRLLLPSHSRILPRRRHLAKNPVLGTVPRDQKAPFPKDCLLASQLEVQLEISNQAPSRQPIHYSRLWPPGRTHLPKRS